MSGTGGFRFISRGASRRQVFDLVSLLGHPSFSPLPTGAPPGDSSSEVRGMALPKVVIVGRPNFAKSSLLNWLAGRRIAIVDDLAGVTRDRVGALVQLSDDENPRFLELIDTGGIGMVDRDDLSAEVDRQIDTAMN